MRICLLAPRGEFLRVETDMVLFAGDSYVSALEALAKTRYTNRRYLYLYLYLGT